MKFPTALGSLAARCVGALLVAVTASSARAEVVKVKIAGLGFSPAQVSAHVGDTIEWVSTDFLAHTATAHNGAWDVAIPPNSRKSVVLKTEGTIDYYCKFHPNMTGRISVAK